MSTTAGDSLTPLLYHRDLFVNRKKEIELVCAKAEALRMGTQVRERTIIFRSYKGTGRTWLLKHLEALCAERGGVEASYVNLDNWKGNASDQAVNEIVGEVIARARKVSGSSIMSSARGKPTSDDEYRELPTGLVDLLSEHVLVLLLDHVYEADTTLLGLLEDRFLVPFLAHPHTLLVMAGRGQAYHWINPQLRLYTDEYDLDPFDENYTKEQLEKQQRSEAHRAPAIYEITGGYPRGNYLLATSAAETDALRMALDDLLTGVPGQERSWLEALCILRSFDEDALSPLWAAYTGNKTILDWPYRAIREQRDRLLRAKLITWREELGGWVLDEAIRRLLERYLRLSKFAVWRRLHCAAYRLYQGWVEQYPDEAQRWQDEANYHAHCLRAEKQDPDQCPED